MKRELLLMRHGKSDWDAGSGDYQRPLKGRGTRDALRMGKWLRQQGLVPDYIVSSPATRALQTAQGVCEALASQSPIVQRDERIYLASAKSLLAVLRDCPAQAHRVLLIGHNPGMEDLLALLSEEPIPVPEDGKLMPTAALARLKIADPWRRLDAGGARLLSITRPRGLPK